MAESEFTLLGDALWLDFVNNALADPAAYARWIEVQGFEPARDAAGFADGSADGFADVCRLRERLVALAEALDAGVHPAATTIDLLNEHLARRGGHERLVRVSGEWRLQFAGAEAASPLDAIVRSAAATLSDPTVTVRRCASHGCALFFLDHSGNGGRRWCDPARCGRSAGVERRRGLRQ